jgi:alpha-amylase
MKIRIWMAWMLGLASLAQAGTAYLGDGHDVLLQGFTWNSVEESPHFWNKLLGQVPEIASSGVTMVWLPPSADSVDRQGYMPKEWYNQNSRYGTQAELLKLIAELTKAHVRSVADIVVDHRCGDRTEFDFQNPRWTDVCAVITKESNKCGSGTPATGENFQGAPALNHLNVQVQSDVKKYLNWTESSLGYSGFRWDSAKGFYSVGEYWDGNRDKLEKWVAGTSGSSAVFDYALKYVLNRCIGSEDFSELNASGKIYGLIGIDPAHSVTFIENHDTASGSPSGNLNNNFPAGKDLEGYAFILTHPGCPTIFYRHYFESGAPEQEAIHSLIQIRKRNGIHALSEVSILRARRGLYAAVIDDKVALKLGPDSWTPPGEHWKMAASGAHYAVWEKQVQ